MEFNDFGLAEPIMKALASKNYVTPTPIQQKAIPVLLDGKDLCGIAQTGTGKTAAFALPILNHLVTKRVRPAQKACRVLVLSPTRELSGQILESFNAYGRHVRLTSALAIGGAPMVCENRLAATPPLPHQAISSNRIRRRKGSSGTPPYASGKPMPNKPAAAA